MSRRARALVGLNRLEEAREALVDGLQFEPNDKVGRISGRSNVEVIADRQELNAFLSELDEKIAEADA